MEAQKSETLISDWQLLQQYVERSSQAAFTMLVERHVNFVYSTCRRELRQAAFADALAEDVTQVVFLILARKASSLRETGTLAGWLYKTSCFACKNAMKQERHRQLHEQNLMAEIMAEDSHSLNSDSNPDYQNPDWSRLEELLHDALSHLNNEQRDVVLLRFFEGKSVREVGESLGITEKAAERRLSRALEKMRQFFSSRGYTVPIVALSALLLENAVQAAPATCVAGALQLAGSVAAGGAVTASVGAISTSSAAASTASLHVVSLSQGVLKAMLLSQIKTGVVASLAFGLMAASTVKIAHFAMASQQKTEASPVKTFTNSLQKPRRIKVKKALPDAKIVTSNAVSAALFSKQARRILLAQPTLPLTKPDEKPAAEPNEEIKPVEAKNDEPKATEPKTDAPAENAPKTLDSMPQNGEIAVQGTLIAVSNGRLIVDVASYTLAGGKGGKVNPPKPKAILLNEATFLHVRGTKVSINIRALRTGIFVLAVGNDKGTGEPLPARDVALWDVETNGGKGFALRTAPLEIVDVAPAQPIVETVDDADVPPEPEKRPYKNVLLLGDFQKATPGLMLGGWINSPDMKARVQEKNGKRWLALTNQKPDNWATVRYSFPLQPDWKRLRISAQMKVKNLAHVTDWWHTTRLDFNFYNDKDQVLRYGRGLNLWENHDWTTLDKSIEVPEGATRLSLEPGFFGSTGDLLLDNIRIEANSPIEGRPIQEGFPEGTFEKIEGSGWPAGFEPWMPDSLQILKEETPAGQINHFARIIAKPPGQSCALDGRYALPPEWRRVKVSARVRLTKYTRGNEAWKTAKIGVSAEDSSGKMVGDYLKSAEVAPTEEWTTVECINSLPKGATLLRVQPQLADSIGILDVDDIKITDASAEDLPHFAITPELPDGQFENLDAKGWPQGWYTDAGKPAVFQTAEENGNHFLRLSSDTQIYAAAKGRFKLPPDWRALKLSGRLRVQNLKQKPGAQGWETARVGFIYQNQQGLRAGDFQPSLELHKDSDWQNLEVTTNVPRDAVYIEIACILNDAAGILDVDDLKLEKAQTKVNWTPIAEWTREFPEGTFENQDEKGNPLHWEMSERAQIIEEDGNKFLRLTNENIRDTVFVSGQWKTKPNWKRVRIRARLRGAALKKGANPFDGARISVLLFDGKDEPMNTAPAVIELKKDGDWTDLQTQIEIPPEAVSIRLMPSLSRTSGIFDVDDIYIEPLTD